MGDRKPLVTVVVAARDREAYIAEALESVWAQRHRPLELVVVDDGSKDRTAEIAQADPRVVYVHQPPTGVSAARNRGVRRASGELVTFLDADDVMLPDRIVEQASYLSRHPDVGCVLARHELMLEPGLELPRWIVKDTVVGDLGGVEPSTAMLATALARRVPFDPTYRSGHCLEWLSRIACEVDVAICEPVLCRRRIHHNNLSADRDLLREDMLRMARDRVAAARRSGRP